MIIKADTAGKQALHAIIDIAIKSEGMKIAAAVMSVYNDIILIEDEDKLKAHANEFIEEVNPEVIH